jgi:adenosylcobalamin-dependent ribonucleoside-triphosphate reductase
MDDEPRTLPEFTVSPGMARAVFDNKYSRPKPDGSMQTWAERVREVVAGNFLLDPRGIRDVAPEFQRTTELAVAGIMPFSGRHLQHGDATQPDKIMELFTNCATAMFSFMSFRLALRGAGVGRDYSGESCRVDWEEMPQIRLVLDSAHPDFRSTEFEGSLESLRDARHKYDSESEQVRWFKVGDSREGWAKIVEILETAAWQRKHADKLFVFDCSDVRPKGSPIHGLQMRPASGPVPLMNALLKVQSLRGAGMKPWKQALFVDHYLAECVVGGGARRVARMATKYWRDRDVIEFIDVKRGGFLWSANNSILVDKAFWEQAADPKPSHARRVFEAAAGAAYWDKTGEPGFINADMLNQNREGMDGITGETLIDRKVYVDLHPRTVDMIGNVLSHVNSSEYAFIVNPCSEISLAKYGGYCVVGDVCLAYVKNLDDALDAVRQMAKFLVRVNLMKSEYSAEVRRTNRIGVSLTGLHEFAWRKFGLTFDNMIEFNDTGLKSTSADFWTFIDSMRIAAEDAAAKFSAIVGLPAPHTVTTVKPSGTIGKVMNCTEGVHLPALAHYLRWVQYKIEDPDLAVLRSRGYPVKDISHRYSGHFAVGFPTRQPIVDMMGSFIVTSDETTPEEQFRWLALLERFWLGPDGRNNNISYTLKYSSANVTFQGFMDMLLEWQPKVRCCAVMPQDDWRTSEKVYGYVPEQPITAEEYADLMSRIAPVEREGYDEQALLCEGGVCPVEPDVRKTSPTEK